MRIKTIAIAVCTILIATSFASAINTRDYKENTAEIKPTYKSDSNKQTSQNQLSAQSEPNTGDSFLLKDTASMAGDSLQTSSVRDIPGDKPLFVPGEILIKFKPGVDISDPKKTLRSIGTLRGDGSSFDSVVSVEHVFAPAVSVESSDRQKTYGLDTWFKITVEKDTNISMEIQKYRENLLVECAQPNYIMTASVVPNDPYYSSSGSWGQTFPDLWGLHKINAAGAWDVSTGSQDVVVAIVDTGIDYNHPDIAANMWINKDEIPGNGIDDDHDGFIDNIYGADFAYGDGDPIDGAGHGTHCAGTIAAVGDNAYGVVGLNWATTLMAVKGLSDEGSGSISNLAAALCWAADNGADVISNSWGSTIRIPSDPAIETAVRYAYDAGCYIVFAAGNANDDVRYYSPNNMDEVINVAATDYLDRKASFSNWGEQVDVCAPGVDILSTFPTNLLPPIRGIITINSDSNRILQSVLGKYSLLPPLEGLSGQVLWAESGYPSNFTGQDFTGKLALMNATGSIYFRNMVRNAAEAGATGAVIFVPGYYDHIPWVTLLEPSLIPAFFVSGIDGEDLHGLIGHGTTVVTLTTVDLGSQAVFSGTSMACPHVAGLIALLLSKNQSMTREMTETILCNAVDPVDSLVSIGRGRINVSDALHREPALIQLDIPDWANAQGLFALTGTAWGEHFEEYVLEYGAGKHPTSWNEIARSASPVEHDVLGVFDVTGLDEGTYTVRLRMICSDGGYEATQMIVVNNHCDQFVVDTAGGPGVYTRIQDAVDVAGKDDTVLLHIGTYYQSVQIDRPINLIGEHAATTIINAWEYEYAVQLNADHIHIRNITILPGSYDYNYSIYPCGIAIFSDDNVISGIIFLGGCRGIYLSGSHNMITENIFANKACIVLESTSYNILSYNKIRGDGFYGFEVSGSSDNTIVYNDFEGVLYGIDVELYSMNNTIDYNRIRSLGDGISVVLNSFHNSISHNSIINTTGVALYFLGNANENTITGNLIKDNALGFLARTLPLLGGDAYDNVLYRNSFVNNTQNAYDPFRNTWYNATLQQGNYWSDFDEPSEGAWDNDSNGIVDTPYRIPGRMMTPNKDNFSLIYPPNFFADAHGMYINRVNVTIQFTGDVIGGLPPYTWSWDLGDGTTSNQQNPQHNYTIDGTYPVNLTVTDTHGNTSSDPTTAIIYESTQILTVDTNGPYRGLIGTPIQFHGSATGGVPPYIWVWCSNDVYSSNEQNPTYSYPNSGYYSVMAEVIDAWGHSATNLIYAVIYEPLVVTCQGPSSGFIGELLHFNGSATGGISPYNFSWDFGDNTSVNHQQNPHHQYMVPGEYLVVLHVTDAVGTTATNTTTVVITPAPLIVHAIGPSTGLVGQPLHFSGYATGGVHPYNWTWDFGDGNISTYQNTTYAYHHSGTYTVTLTVNDSAGNTASNITTVAITMIAHTNGPYHGAIGQPVQFTGSVEGGFPQYTWSWDFGDENTSTDQNPAHTYHSIGTYTVTLTVVDSEGNTASDTTNATIKPGEVFVDDDYTESTPGWGYDHFDTIHDGIDAVGEQGTVFVSAGTYHENVVINKPLNLIGNDKQYTVIDGGLSNAVEISVTNQVLLRDFTIKNSMVGILIQISNYVTVSNTFITDCFESGISLNCSCFNTITGNTITNSTIGLSLKRYSENNIITRNTINNHSIYGISLDSSSENTIEENNLLANQYEGIHLINSCVTTIISNTISESNYGLYLISYYGHNHISGNTILNSHYDGIRISSAICTDNVITGNTIANSSRMGINLGSNGNVIYHNNFINNGINNAYDTYNNTWYNPVLHEGNYWSDFDEPVEGAYDTNNDGIIDSPYNISGRTPPNQDLYPLAHRFVLGDMNHDGYVSWRDIDPFVLAMSDPATYQFQYHMLYTLHGDLTGDGQVNWRDIEPFIVLLNGG